MMRAALTALAFTAFASAAQAQAPRWEDVREFPTEEQLAAAQELERVPWIEMPDARDYAAVYPHRSQRTTGGVSRGGDSANGGAVTLNCIVEPDYRLACRPVAASDTMFVRPALMVATKFRVAETTPDGTPTVGRRIDRTIRFIMN